ncbi:hypothetical protein HaLaN_32716, partial [Haematococcus lacustris]
MMKEASLHGVALVGSRLQHAMGAPGTSGQWLRLLPISLLLNAGMLAAGIPTGLVRLQPVKDARSLGWAAAYVMMRSILEEL